MQPVPDRAGEPATVTDVPSGARNGETITAGRAAGSGAGLAAEGAGVRRAVHAAVARGRLAAGLAAAFGAVLAVAEHAARLTATAAPSGHAAARICSSLGAGPRLARSALPSVPAVWLRGCVHLVQAWQEPASPYHRRMDRAVRRP